jgi:hypothetical protein
LATPFAWLTGTTHSISQRSQRPGPGPRATISASARAREGGPLTCDNGLRDGNARCWPARVRAGARLARRSRNQTRPAHLARSTEAAAAVSWPGRPPARSRCFGLSSGNGRPAGGNGWSAHSDGRSDDGNGRSADTNGRSDGGNGGRGDDVRQASRCTGIPNAGGVTSAPVAATWPACGDR